MELYTLIAILITLVAIFDFLNYHVLHLPRTIGLLLISLCFSILLVVIGQFETSFSGYALDILHSMDFNKTLMHGMLSFLLFAGALHIDLDDLKKEGWVIGLTSTLGVIISMVLVGLLCSFMFGIFGLNVDLLYCLIFGALISPTDPIAVIGVLKTAKVPKRLQIRIAGESLFNDGVGVVFFTVLYALIASDKAVSPTLVFSTFVKEALGGIAFGLLLGNLGYRMLKTIDDYSIEIFITLALVTGGYALAMALHVSGPLAVVVAGLLIGNTGRRFGMSSTTRENLDTFWEVIDDMLNAILFVLIGLEVLVIDFSSTLIGIGLITIIPVLFSRFASVGLMVRALRSSHDFSPHAVKIMTWAGIRGGISVALALSLPPGPEREILLAITYTIVIFSIAVQGLTIGPLARKLLQE